MITDIIFDWGGVLALADNPLAAKTLAKKYNLDEIELAKGLANFEHMFEISENCQGYFERVNRGYGIPRKEIESALNAAHATHVLEVARQLKQNSWPLHLLSDQLHFRTRFIKEHNDLSFFDNLFFSSETGFIKPEKEAYLNVLNKINRTPDQCVFIDNNQDNVVGAEKVGIKSILFKNEGQLQSELEKLGIAI